MSTCVNQAYAAYISWEVDSGMQAAVACGGQRRHTPNFPRERR